MPPTGFNYINTFDLTVDHAFYDALMQPWALRNVLDAFSGALPGTGYSFDTPLYNPSGTQVSSHGFSFYHDMGLFPTSGTGPAYGANMGDEELESWILSAGLYWSHTADNGWLTNNVALLQACLNSMLLRDNTNSAARDGITKNVNGGEITTFDSLDASLVRPAFSGRLAVRNWACYLALNSMFSQVGDPADAAICQSMAAVAAQTIVSRWNTYQTSLGYIPALLDGSGTAAITPLVEGLAYPAAMGLTNAIDRTGGPYAAMLQALSNHLVSVLVPGRCLDAASGGWRMTSANSLIWQSNIFAFNGTGVLQNPGGVHYPRGITSALWWLNAANNPPNPVPSVGPSISASLSASRITVSWPSAYVGWILQTNTVGLGNPAAWCDVPDSLTHSQIIFPAGGPNIPAEFFRLRHP